MPHWIDITQVKDPDGTVKHLAGCGCPLEPCATVGIEGTVVDECGYLCGVMIDEDAEVRWQCNKPPCQSGV